jgi:hypothetical protein
MLDMLQIVRARSALISPEAPAGQRPDPQGQSLGRKRPGGSFELRSRCFNHCVSPPRVSGPVGGLDSLDFRREA